MTTFFDEIVECVISPKRAETERGRRLLRHFHEPKETRLGMSQEGVNGHGGADDVGAAIWKALSTNAKALIKVGILECVEDIPIFVYGVDKDITSDLTTRIIFDPLAKFTNAMMKKYPQFTQEITLPGRLDVRSGVRLRNAGLTRRLNCQLLRAFRWFSFPSIGRGHAC